MGLVYDLSWPVNVTIPGEPEKISYFFGTFITPRVLHDFGSVGPLDLCLFVPCFLAFFDLLISLGQ